MSAQGNLGRVFFPSAFPHETVRPDVYCALGQDRLRTSVFTWTHKTPFSTWLFGLAYALSCLH